MKWILPISIFFVAVYLLKQIDKPQPIELVTEEVAIKDIFCGTIGRSDNNLNFTVSIKPQEYRFKASLEPNQCDEFLNHVKNNDVVRISYFPAGYKRFALAELNANGTKWVKQ